MAQYTTTEVGTAETSILVEADGKWTLATKFNFRDINLKFVAKEPYLLEYEAWMRLTQGVDKARVDLSGGSVSNVDGNYVFTSETDGMMLEMHIPRAMLGDIHKALVKGRGWGLKFADPKPEEVD